MFGPLGVPEILFLLVLALLIFGPRKLPEIGRTLGRGMAEFRKASNELRRTLNAEAIEQGLQQAMANFQEISEMMQATYADVSAQFEKRMQDSLREFQDILANAQK